MKNDHKQLLYVKPTDLSLATGGTGAGSCSYKLWFSIPNMRSIVWWNLVDGYAAYAPLGSETGENYYCAGLLRFDMTEKPAYAALDRLINHEWKTNLTASVEDGKISFRGFYGEYEIQIGDECISVTLDTDGKTVAL